MQDRRLPWAQSGTDLQIETLRTLEPERVRAHPFGKLAREDAQVDQVGSVDALEATSDDRANTEQTGTLAAQSRELPAP